MTASIVELAGIFLVVIGLGAVVAAASLVSTPLAVFAAGVFVIFGGSCAILIANRPVRGGSS